MDGLYDRDFLLWSEAEAEKLRRLQRGERVNDVDWENLIEEVEALGRSELNATGGLLHQAVLHILKAVAWPGARHRKHWMVEAVAFLDRAAETHTPAMTQRLDLDRLYRRARRLIRMDEYEGQPPGPLPEAPWFTLAELLAEDVRPEDILARAPRG